MRRRGPARRGGAAHRLDQFLGVDRLGQEVAEARLQRALPGYRNAMKGRRQLFWSHGLKEKCAISEVTDEALAQQIEEGAALLALIPATAWRYVVGNDARCELLDAAETGGFDAVCYLLRSLGVPELSMPVRAVEQVAA